SALFVLLGTACFHELEAPPVPTANGTLTGIVNFVGMPCMTKAPDGQLVEQHGSGCSGPMAGYEVTVVAKDGKTVVATTKTDASGVYTLALPAGDYTIFTQRGIHPENQQPTDATVTIGNTTKLDLMIDAGIR